MSVKKTAITPPAKPKLPPVPYFSEWDADDLGRPQGLIAALVRMLLAWVGQGLMGEPRRFTGLPGPMVLQDEFKRLGLPTTLQFPATCISVQPGDVCLVDYSKLPSDCIQDVNFQGWEWMVYLGMDEKHVYVNDPNWSGKRRNDGNALAIPLDAWEHAFRPHTRGLACIRLVTPGPLESIVDYHEPLDEEDTKIIHRLAAIYGGDDQPELDADDTSK